MNMIADYFYNNILNKGGNMTNATCETGNCKVDVNYESLVNDENLGIMARINLFVEAVEKDEDLEIVNNITEDGVEYFVFEDKRFDNEQTIIPIGEIIDKVINSKSAYRVVQCIAGREKAIVLNGITRIVGYYSRINNWNKSKIGELRDRSKGKYWTKEKEYNEA